MFTGIIQELGTVSAFDLTGGMYRLAITAKKISADVNVGDSVAVNGVCLTATSIAKETLTFDVMAETIRKTGLVRTKRGDRINLEGSLKANGSLGGHFVLGHIDCVGAIKRIEKKPGEYAVIVRFPDGYSHLIVEKGSIAIDGISLTVGRTGENEVTVYLIPHTVKSTTLEEKKAGDCVNLEFDIIGKYVERQQKVSGAPRISEGFLRENGF